MRTRHLAVAAAMTILPALAGAARADIALVNQTDVTLRFVFTPYAEPGQMAMAVICNEVEVEAGVSATVAKTPFCGERADVAANAPPNSSGWSQSCRSEGLSWTSGRLTVTGSRTALACIAAP